MNPIFDTSIIEEQDVVVITLEKNVELMGHVRFM